jgi:hypothetical protein
MVGAGITDMSVAHFAGDDAMVIGFKEVVGRPGHRCDPLTSTVV